jgi:hypothetical protein
MRSLSTRKVQQEISNYSWKSLTYDSTESVGDRQQYALVELFADCCLNPVLGSLETSLNILVLLLTWHQFRNRPML